MVGNASSLRLARIWAELGGHGAADGLVALTGEGRYESAFAVTDLAVASVGSAALALADLVAAMIGKTPAVSIDRRLASLWFSSSLVPQGWQVPPLWDALAGDYRTRDGWIRLHTNAPHHRRAAQSVLGPQETREAMAVAVARWDATELESAVVAAGGCAAEMREAAAWQAHPAGRAVAGEPLAAVVAGPGPGARGWAGVAARPLAGLRVLDLTRVLAGPVATRLLAALGAEVLRIDPPWWDEPGVVPEMTVGKRCARLDLNRPEDRATFEALLLRADVLVHGYRSDALEGMGMGAAVRAALAPHLVDVALDAYGWSGPWAHRRGFDSLVQMSSGIAAAGMRWKQADRPVPLPVQALDHAAGYALAAMALRGLAHRADGGGAFTARLSLARMAKVLMDWGPDDDPQGLPPIGEADLAPAVEHTFWGPARRLRHPFGVEGVTLGWSRGAVPLGADPARWTN